MRGNECRHCGANERARARSRDHPHAHDIAGMRADTRTLSYRNSDRPARTECQDSRARAEQSPGFFASAFLALFSSAEEAAVRDLSSRPVGSVVGADYANDPVTHFNLSGILIPSSQTRVRRPIAVPCIAPGRLLHDVARRCTDYPFYYFFSQSLSATVSLDLQ